MAAQHTKHGGERCIGHLHAPFTLLMRCFTLAPRPATTMAVRLDLEAEKGWTEGNHGKPLDREHVELAVHRGHTQAISGRDFPLDVTGSWRWRAAPRKRMNGD